MTGAALATFITCLISYSWQQWIVLKKVKGNPYTIGIVKQIFLILFLLGVDIILPSWSSNPFVDIFYRTSVIILLWIYLTYRLKISDEMSLLLRKYIK